jgi:hypothetical protein
VELELEDQSRTPSRACLAKLQKSMRRRQPKTMTDSGSEKMKLVR